MFKVLILGAGSIGNHLAHACRSRGWDVTISDIDPAALQRTREVIYPSRYGSWDDAIKLVSDPSDWPSDPDVAIIGTPPDLHIKLALFVLEKAKPRLLLVEKPLSTPNLESCQELADKIEKMDVIGLVGYNHTTTPHTTRAREVLSAGHFGEPLLMEAVFREYWGGIFQAHPWLNGPRDSYLGYRQRGGGAGGEHSHALNIWQHFAHYLGMGRIVEVIAGLDLVKSDDLDYDRVFHLSVRTDKGFFGTVTQDVVTEPPRKELRIQFTNGFLLWRVNHRPDADALIWQTAGGKVKEEIFPKMRPDDFKGEIAEIERLLEGGDDSPLDIKRGLETMLAVRAGYESGLSKRAARIDYTNGWTIEAVSLI